MPDRTSHVAEAPSRRDLLLTRICDAPREIVFQAWTAPELLVATEIAGAERHLAQWRQGWSQTLDRLAEEVASTRRTTGHE
jgi:uncharacterized protein YndB with AHSA1/START domain